MIFPQLDIQNFKLPENYFGCIYQILNIQNNKSYIGKTVSIDPIGYLEGHFDSAIKNKDDNSKDFYKAIRKYGRKNFKYTILGYIYYKTEERNSKINKKLNREVKRSEKACIFHFRTFGSDGENIDFIYGYNMTKGGDGFWKGYTPWNKGLTTKTDERVFNLGKSVSKSSKGKIKSPEHLENVRQALLESDEIRNLRWINNGIISKRVKEDRLQSFLDNNWVLGRLEESPCKNRRHIFKNEQHKMVPKEELESWINLGWTTEMNRDNFEFLEKNSERNKNGKWMKKDGNCRLVQKENIRVYAELGWVYGKNSSMKNQIYINKNGKMTTIKKEDLQLYLDQGWVEGALKRENRRNTKGIIKNGIYKIVKIEELQQYLDDDWIIGGKKKLENKRWMTNGIDSIQVKKEEVQKYINNGWKIGRTLKNK